MDEKLKAFIREKARQYVFVGDHYYYVNRENGRRRLKRRGKAHFEEYYGEATGKEVRKLVDKFLDFTCQPVHREWEERFGDYYNKYNPPPYQPQRGWCPRSLEMVQHIFGEHFELGLDYLKVMWEQPKQPLPILCLVSKENGTGKTKFKQWVRAIFGSNAREISNSDLEDSKYNDDWIQSLLVCIDETSIEKHSVKEMLKRLSTDNTATVNKKYEDRDEVDIFCKFLLCSNQERNFLPIKKEDKRFWVRKVFQPETENPDILEELIGEIPAFLHYLEERPYHVEREGRMWFKPERYLTEWFYAAAGHHENPLVADLKIFLTEQFQAAHKSDPNVDVLYYQIGMLQTQLKRMADRPIQQSLIRQALEGELGLKAPGKPTRKPLWFESEGVNLEGEGAAIRGRPTLGRWWEFPISLVDVSEEDKDELQDEVIPF